MTTPYYDQGGIKIYHGDCREIIPSLSADSLVTDPPYGIKWERATWEDNPEEYAELIKWLVGYSKGSIKGWCFVFQAMPNVNRFHEWFPDGWRLFAACKNFAQIRKTGLWHSWDPVVFWNNGTESKPNSINVNRDYHIGNVSGLFRTKSKHPCPRPIDTMRHIVSMATPVGGVVIDPFMGSGTTLRAAKDCGCNAIGIDINEQYCEFAANRLSQNLFSFDSFDDFDETDETDEVGDEILER